MNLIKSQNQYTKQKLQKNSLEETVIIWFAFKPGLELTLAFEQPSSVFNTLSAVNFNKTHDLDEL